MTGKTKILTAEDQTSVPMVLHRIRGSDCLERRKSHVADSAKLDLAISISHFNWHLLGKKWFVTVIKNSQSFSGIFCIMHKN